MIIITCYTLFDITQTGVLNRQRTPLDEDQETWLYRRNTQCNFDTILQSISLRSQPEVTTTPVQFKVEFDKVEYFGYLFNQVENEQYNCWTFDFSVQHPSVFSDGITELGHLYNDCDGVPMIKCGTEWTKLPSFLDTSDELRNIYFEVKNNERS